MVEKNTDEPGIDIHIPWGVITGVPTGIVAIFFAVAYTLNPSLQGLAGSAGTTGGPSADGSAYISQDDWLRLRTQTATNASQIAEHQRRLDRLKIPPPSFERRVEILEEQMREMQRGN